MKRKSRLVMAFASLMFIVAFSVYSVWAISSITYGITSSVSYTTLGNVYATITPATSVGENTTKEGGVAPSAITLNGDETSTTGTIAISAATLTATSVNGHKTVIYSYTITIKNNAPTGITKPRLKVDFTEPATKKVYAQYSYGVTIEYDGTVDSPSASVTLAYNETVIITVTFTGDARVNHGSIDIGSSVELEAVA